MKCQFPIKKLVPEYLWNDLEHLHQHATTKHEVKGILYRQKNEHYLKLVERLLILDKKAMNFVMIYMIKICILSYLFS